MSLKIYNSSQTFLYWYFSIFATIWNKFETCYFNSPSEFIYLCIFAFYVFIELVWQFSFWRHFLLIAKYMENLAVIIYVLVLDEKMRVSEAQLVNDAVATCA